MVKCLPEFEYFTVFLKNKNIIFKIRRIKVTDYAALTILVHLTILPIARMSGSGLYAFETHERHLLCLW